MGSAAVAVPCKAGTFQRRSDELRPGSLWVRRLGAATGPWPAGDIDGRRANICASANTWKFSRKVEPALNHQHDGRTLQGRIDVGMAVTGGCLDCHRHQRLDPPALRDRFGPDAPAMTWDLRPKMKCAVCGGKRITLTYSPGPSPKKPQQMTSDAYAVGEGRSADERATRRSWAVCSSGLRGIEPA